LQDRRRSKTDLQISGMEQGYSAPVIHNALVDLLVNEQIEKNLNTMMFSKKR
jgi:hypothetical protein